MKIGIIVRVIQRGGIPKIAINETKGLIQNGLKAELVIYRWGNQPHQLQDIFTSITARSFDKGFLRHIAAFFAKFTLVLLPIGRGLESSVDISTIILAPTFFSKKDYDFLLCHDQLAGISGLIAGKKGIPYFTFVHEPLFVAFPLGAMKISKYRILSKIVGSIIYSIEKKVLINSAGIFFNSKKTENWVKTCFPSIKGKTKVIYPGCNPTERLPEEREEFILAVSRWDIAKYPTFILDLAERLDANFVIAGAWTPQSLLNDFINEINNRRLDEKVKVLIDLSEKDVKSLFLRAKMYIHWIPEGFSMGVLEAMAHGLPVITTRRAGASEIITNGVDGFIVEKPGASFIDEETDLDGYVRIINLLLKNPNLCKSVGKNAWETSKKYSWQEHTKQLLNLVYDKLNERSS